MAKTVKHIHILGIAGVMTAQIAATLKQQGYIVTGSDQEKIYPPTDSLIVGIPLNNTPISRNIDAVIVGSSYSSFSRCVNEFEQVKQLKIPYTSATEFIAKSLIKTNSILVAGSYGKSTVSALVSWIMDKSGYYPNYFFGGQLVDGTPSMKSSISSWSVVEADESINGLNTQAKFLYYPVKYLIITSAQWEHKDSYSTAEENLAAYQQLVEKVPKDGFIVFNGHDKEINKIISHSLAPTFDYQTTQTYSTKLIGQYNQENISAAYTFCHKLGIKSSRILKAISSFPGLKRRLELINQKNQIVVYDDFAQSATRVKTALEALAFSYPKYRLKVYFEPHASFLQNRSSLQDFSKIVPLVDDFILGKISFSQKLPADQRISARDWQKIFNDKLHYLPTDDSIVDYLSTNLRPGDLLVHFSSGGLAGLQNLRSTIATLALKTL